MIPYRAMYRPMKMRIGAPGNPTNRVNTAVLVVKAERKTMPLGLASG